MDKNALIELMDAHVVHSVCRGRCVRPARYIGPDSDSLLIVMWLDSCLLGAFVGRLARVVVLNRCRHHNWRDSSTANEGVDVDECKSRWKLCRDCYVVLNNLAA